MAEIELQRLWLQLQLQGVTPFPGTSNSVVPILSHHTNTRFPLDPETSNDAAPISRNSNNGLQLDLGTYNPSNSHEGPFP